MRPDSRKVGSVEREDVASLDKPLEIYPITVQLPYKMNLNEKQFCFISSLFYYFATGNRRKIVAREFDSLSSSIYFHLSTR